MKKDITIEEIEKFKRKKLSQLSDGDLARFIRQGMYLEFILHECINRLYKNPYSGEKYDGEILDVLSKKVEDSFWRGNEGLKNYMINLLSYFNSKVAQEKFEQLDKFEKEEILSSIKQLRKKLL